MCRVGPDKVKVCKYILFTEGSSEVEKLQNIMESCGPGLTGWILVYFKEKLYPPVFFFILLFALPCPPVYKPWAVGRGIAIRAKVEQRGKVIFREPFKLSKMSNS